MVKNIVICSDGTGNSSVKGRGTNVFELFEAVDLNGHRRDQNLRPQVAIYDEGVGTESLKIPRLLGGGHGMGPRSKCETALRGTGAMLRGRG